jgi:tRNA (5-methylaminomethyl-2-thiouridylate)-methyltransferase
MLRRLLSPWRSCLHLSGSYHFLSSSVIDSNSKGHVAVAMSGGIDSATVAHLLLQQGYTCTGVFMRNWDERDEIGDDSVCTVSQDRKDMQELCIHLNIPFVEVDFVKEYWNAVFVPFLESYQSGIETPNPDVFCNKHIKFNALRHHVFNNMQVDYLATGHYVRIGKEVEEEGEEKEEGGGVGELLLRGVDTSKDQSYFLAMVQQEQLRDVLFPLGNMLKSEVKSIAAAAFEGKAVLRKRESMGICFVGKRHLPDFLGQYIDLTPGRFIDADSGQVMGKHGGKELLTVGQNARIAGQADKYFVASFHPSILSRNNNDDDGGGGGGGGGTGNKNGVKNGDVYVVRGSEHPALYRDTLSTDLNKTSWVRGQLPAALQGGTVMKCQAKTRYSTHVAECEVAFDAERAGSQIQVRFAEPQRAITAGQIVVFYQGDVCLGGGVINPFHT